jgi:hypothetical protein
MHLRAYCLGIAAFMLATSALVAHADSVDVFTMVIDNDTITWSIPMPAVPIETMNGAVLFTSPIVFNGMNTSDSFEFFSPRNYSNIGFSTPEASYSYQLYLSVLASGTPESPIFYLGDLGVVGNGIVGNLNIAEVSSPSEVSEPSTLALLSTGLLGVIGAIRLRYS